MSTPDPDCDPAEAAHTNTQGGAYVGGSVDTRGGPFIGRDQIIYAAARQKADLSAAEIARYEEAYRTQVRRACRYIHTEGLGEPATELTGVFVMLQAVARPKSQERSLLSERMDVVPLPERFEQMGLPEQQAQPLPPPVPLTQALHEHAHLVVLGEPGTGKSTTLQYVALCIATQGWATEKLTLTEGSVPVPLSLRSYGDARTLSDFLADGIAHLGMFDPADSTESRRIAVTLLDTWLQQKRLVLLLDALDEAPESQRAAVWEQIVCFAATAAGQACRVILTSRIAGYTSARRFGEEFDEYTIRPFQGSDDALPYASGWLQVLANPPLAQEQAVEQARNLLAHMAQQQGLRRILSNPLLLRLAIAVQVESGEPVSNRAEIYRRYVDEVLWQRTKGRHNPPFARQQVQEALAYVAWTLHTEPDSTASQLDVGIQRIANGQADGERLLEFLQQDLGLLAAYDYDKGAKLAFRHLTFQEFLVGRRLAQRWEADKEATWRLLVPLLHHPSWREPIQLMAGLLHAADMVELTRSILTANSAYERELHRDLLLAMGIVADSGRVDRKTIDAIVNRVKAIAQNSGSELEFATNYFGPAARILYGFRWENGVATSQQKERLAEGLSKLGNAAVPALLKALSDSHSGVRWIAADALGQLGDTVAVPSLVDAYSDSDSNVRWAAGRALSQLGADDMIPLLKALKVAISHVSRPAADARGQLGAAATVRAVLKSVSGSLFVDHGLVAVELLGMLGAAAVPALLDALSDSNSVVRSIAARALGKICAAAVPALLDALSGSDAHVRSAAAEALGQTGDAGAVPALLKALSDSDAHVRSAAAKALGQIGDAGAVPALLKALSDSHSGELYLIVIEALGQIGDAGAVPALLKALSDSHSGVRSAAAKALGQIGDAGAVPALLKALSDSHSGVRSAAARALGQIGDADTVPALLKALSGFHSSVRCAAVEAFSTLLSNRNQLDLQQAGAAARNLAIRVYDRDPNVRNAALLALEQAVAAVAVRTVDDSRRVGDLRW